VGRSDPDLLDYFELTIATGSLQFEVITSRGGFYRNSAQRVEAPLVRKRLELDLVSQPFPESWLTPAGVLT